MCGIAGLIGIDYNEKILQKIHSTMLRRGPDGRGIVKGDGWALLHSRLAIVDPEGGTQPMQLEYAGEKYTLVYNGELYNTQQIKQELISLGHSFCSHSDTEVVLHAYAQWQDKCLDKFNGIFGFALWEHKKRRLFLARDRIGVKPLFYALQAKGIVFGSEMKSILAHPAFKAELDREGVYQLLLLGPGRIPGSGVFRGIYEMEPGWCAYFRDGKLNLRQYWRLQDREHKQSFQETADYVRYLVTDAIERQMVSDVPLGTFLSGGLDSSLISAVCAKQMKQPLKTFSVDYENNDSYFVSGKFQPESDNRYIRLMQQYLGSEHCWTVLTAQELADTLQEATIARDLPGMGDVDFSLLAFCKRIRQEVKMALSGECADEIFGGYPWYRDQEVRDYNGFPWAQNTKLRAAFLADGLKDEKNAESFVMDQYRKSLQACDILPGTCPQERRMKEMVNLNMRWFMQTLLDRKDRMSMYSGLEVRVPFCDYRLAEYMYGVPWEYKDYQGREKGLLRYAMADYLPREVLYRKKSPYPKTWDPQYAQIMRSQMQQLLEQKDAPIFQIVGRKALEDLMSENFVWPWYGQLMRAPQTMAYMLQIHHWLSSYQVSFIGM